MKVDLLLLLLLISIAGKVNCAQTAKSTTPSESKAFFEARRAFLELRENKTPDASLRWSSNLRILADSPARVADTYLVTLGLFKIDGESNSEYSCAAARRSQHLAVLMQEQLINFDKSNYCKRTATSKKLNYRSLCATKREFSVRVDQYRSLPLPDSEQACSY